MQAYTLLYHLYYSLPPAIRHTSVTKVMRAIQVALRAEFDSDPAAHHALEDSDSAFTAMLEELDDFAKATASCLQPGVLPSAAEEWLQKADQVVEDLEMYLEAIQSGMDLLERIGIADMIASAQAVEQTMPKGEAPPAYVARRSDGYEFLEKVGWWRPYPDTAPAPGQAQAQTPNQHPSVRVNPTTSLREHLRTMVEEEEELPSYASATSQEDDDEDDWETLVEILRQPRREEDFYTIIENERR